MYTKSKNVRSRRTSKGTCALRACEAAPSAVAHASRHLQFSVPAAHPVRTAHTSIRDGALRRAPQRGVDFSLVRALTILNDAVCVLLLDPVVRSDLRLGDLIWHVVDLSLVADKLEHQRTLLPAAVIASEHFIVKAGRRAHLKRERGKGGEGRVEMHGSRGRAENGERQRSERERERERERRHL